MFKVLLEMILRKDLRVRFVNVYKFKMCNYICNFYLLLLKIKEIKFIGKKFVLFFLYLLNK